MDETLPKTIVFKISKLPYLEVTDNMKNMTLYISTVNSDPLIKFEDDEFVGNHEKVYVCMSHVSELQLP